MTDIPRDKHERYAGPAEPGHTGPPGEEPPGAGTGELDQGHASATLPPSSPPATAASGEGSHRYPNTAFGQPGFI
jgi:hypothetical protein